MNFKKLTLAAIRRIHYKGQTIKLGSMGIQMNNFFKNPYTFLKFGFNKIKLSVLEVPFEFADSGTWTLDGSTLTQTYKEGELFDDGEVYVFSAIITDVTLTLTDSDGTVLVFRKKDN